MAKNTVNPFDTAGKTFSGPGGKTNPAPPRAAAPATNGPGARQAGMPFGAPDFMKGKKFTQDDANAANTNFVSLGRHLAAIRKVDGSRTTRKGDPMIVFTVEVIDGPDIGKEKDYFFAVMDKTLWLIPELGNAMGIPGPWGLEDFEASVGTVVVIAVVEGQEYQGRPQTNIDRFYPPEEMGIASGTQHASGTPLVR